MAVTGKRLYHGRPGTSDTLLYTCTGPVTKTRIMTIRIVNLTAAAATIRLTCPAGASMGSTGNAALFWDFEIPAHGVHSLDANFYMDVTETIRATVSIADALAVQVHGIELS